ncbi:pimeloyl-ACP methyl ester carboxylesterase [Nocardia transvalensis]|uniref:Pimeloyl-ACP methyl ester carboxylesterase n=1 Tax=Nocardia transvalensis TaxID=37333 RepID=A0A7W9PHT1_9NOCA|nr:alpha/beta hydrolase [Nocardia transvalensis]MBB5916326.1 pimeloyl-ACP methyl ester carboxylesterase [Nocardia transvalensis]
MARDPARRSRRPGSPATLGRAAVLAVVAIVSATACAVLPVVRPPDFYPAELARFYTQTPRWDSCADMTAPDTPVSPETRCATLTVPLDYDHPEGATVEVAVSRKPATGDRLGALLFNPGGPGLRGLAMVDSVDGTRLAQRFDRIGFDPRGIGASTPRISCGDPAAYFDAYAPWFDTTPEGIAENEAMSRAMTAHCEKHSGTPLLAHVGTREVIRDMDIVRAVAGADRTMNYVGYSYGTRLGWAYAERFPDRVRTMTLDGVIAPQEDTYTRTLHEHAAFQQAFDSLAMDCARRADCPLGPDPARAPQRLRELIVPLQTDPLPSRRDPATRLYYGDVLQRTQNALYSSRSWDAFLAALRALRDHDPDPMLGLPARLGRTPDPERTAEEDARQAVLCVDEPPIRDRAVNDRLDVESRRAAPFQDDGHGTGHAPLDACAFWPVPPTGAPHPLSIPGLPTLLVVSTTYDPATPYQAGVDLAGQLGARLITYRGTRHTVALTGHSPCVDAPTVDYLLTRRPPARDLTC